MFSQLCYLTISHRVLEGFFRSCYSWTYRCCFLASQLTTTEIWLMDQAKSEDNPETTWNNHTTPETPGGIRGEKGSSSRLAKGQPDSCWWIPSLLAIVVLWQEHHSSGCHVSEIYATLPCQFFHFLMILSPCLLVPNSPVTLWLCQT